MISTVVRWTFTISEIVDVGIEGTSRCLGHEPADLLEVLSFFILAVDLGFEDIKALAATLWNLKIKSSLRDILFDPQFLF